MRPRAIEDGEQPDFSDEEEEKKVEAETESEAKREQASLLDRGPPHNDNFTRYLTKGAWKELWRVCVLLGTRVENSLDKCMIGLVSALKAMAREYSTLHPGPLSLTDFRTAVRTNNHRPVREGLRAVSVNSRPMFKDLLELVGLRILNVDGSDHILDSDAVFREEDRDPYPDEVINLHYGTLTTRLAIDCHRTLHRAVYMGENGRGLNLSTGSQRFKAINALFSAALAVVPSDSEYKLGSYSKTRLIEFLSENDYGAFQAMLDDSAEGSNGTKRTALKTLVVWLAVDEEFMKRLCEAERPHIYPPTPGEQSLVGRFLTKGAFEDFVALVERTKPQHWKFVFALSVSLQAAFEKAGLTKNKQLLGQRLDKAALVTLLRDSQQMEATLAGTDAALESYHQARVAWWLFLGWLDNAQQAALLLGDDEASAVDDDDELDLEDQEQEEEEEDNEILEKHPERLAGWLKRAGDWRYIVNDPELDGPRLPLTAVDENPRRWPFFYTPAMMQDLLENGSLHPRLLTSKLGTLWRFADVDVPLIKDKALQQQLMIRVEGAIRATTRSLAFNGHGWTKIQLEHWRELNEKNVKNNAPSTPAKMEIGPGLEYEVWAKAQLREGIDCNGLGDVMRVAPVLENARPDIQMFVGDGPARKTFFVQVKGIRERGRLTLTRNDTTLPATWYDGYVLLLVAEGGEMWATTWGGLVRAVGTVNEGDDVPAEVDLSTPELRTAMEQWRVPYFADGEAGERGIARVVRELHGVSERLGHAEEEATFLLNGVSYPLPHIRCFTGQPLSLHFSGVRENNARRDARHRFFMGTDAAVALCAADGKERVGLDMRLVGEGERDGAVYDEAVCLTYIRRVGNQVVVEEPREKEIDLIQTKPFHPMPRGPALYAKCFHNVEGKSHSPYSSKDPIDVFHFVGGNMTYTMTHTAFLPMSVMRILGFVNQYTGMLIYPPVDSVLHRLAPWYPHRYAWVQSRFMRTPEQMQEADVGAWWSVMREVWIAPYRGEYVV